jgi:glycosyltransferase involved in cell wall biosynthesis
VRLLFALPYGPGITRVRSRMLLETLAQRHDITLAAMAWGADDRAALDEWRGRGLEVHAVSHPRAAQLRGLLGDPRRPLQQAASSSPELARLVRDLIAGAARRGRPFDAVHVEHIRGAVALGLPAHPGVRTVFDAVDCIAELARLTRRHNPSSAVRLLAAIEEARTRRLETVLVTAADATTVVAERDRVALLDGGAPDRIAVIPNGVPVVDVPGSPTGEPVAIFTGKLSYHANQAALRILLTSVWPHVRAALPDAQLIVAGAEPPGWLAAHTGRDGVAVIADPPAMLPLIAKARVALAPMVYGVGIQNKVLEAMACGVPVVATRFAIAGLFPAARERFLLADTPAAFAGQTIRLLNDAAFARQIGRGGREYAREYHSWDRSAALFEALYAGNAPKSLVAPERDIVKVA